MEACYFMGLERFIKTLKYEEVDRPATWLGIPAITAEKALFEYFGVNSVKELAVKLKTDIYAVEMPYESPTSNAIYAAFDFSKQKHDDAFERTLTEDGFFANCEDPAKVNDFDWPEPIKYIDKQKCLAVVNEAPEGMAVMGVVWSAHFQDTCAAFGMENALCTMLSEPEMFEAVINRITDFYLDANEIFYEATKGKLHAVLIGNDFGSQINLMVSPDLIRKYVLPGTKKLVEQAKKYGLYVVHHSCGAIFDIIPDLIECGVDVIHPIQALAKDMNAENIKEHFYGKVAFCGGVDAQNLLVNGTVQDIKKDVKRLKALFPTGLIISPSHEAILPDIKPENIQALFSLD
jgi:uroporphyrinogen decarboxylase